MQGKGLFLFLAIFLVNVKDSFQQFIVTQDQQQNEVRDIQTSVIFTVQVTATAPAGIWSRDGVDIPGTIPQKIYIVPSGTLRYLYILNIQPSDGGTYMYRINNERRTFTLAVRGVQITTDLQNVQSTPGSTATFTAVLQYENVTNGVWTKDGVPVVFDNRISARVDRAQQILTINNVQPSDAGLYQYAIPQNSATAGRLTVTSTGLFFTTGLQSQTVVIGTSATFRAILSQTGITGRWFRNGTQIFADSNTLISFSGNTHTLIITNAGPPNVGDYMFRTDGSNLESQGTLLVLYITRDLNSGSVAVQTTVVLEAELSLPGYQGQWFRGSTPLPDRAGVGVSVDNTRQLLTITDFRVSDAGAYQFQVQGLQSTATLQALYITNPASDQTTGLGGTVRLSVILSVEGYTGGTWRRNNVPINTVGTRFVAETIGREQRLTITNIQSADFGPYTYLIQTGSQESTATVSLATGVSIVRGLDPQTVVIGRSATFEAVVSQTGLTAQWFRNETQLANNAKTIIQVQGSTHSLTVTNAVPSDAGMYMFRGISGSQQLESRATLNVLYITRDIGGRIVVVGTSVTLEVELSLSGYTGTWFRGNVQLPDRFGVDLSVDNTRHRLTITNFRVSDEGLYQFQVEGLQSTATLQALYITTPAFDQFTSLGNNVTISVILSLPDYTGGTWFRNGIPMTHITNRQHIETIGREQRLTLFNIQASDITQYRYIIQTGGPESVATLRIGTGVPVDGQYGQWGDWSFNPCDNTCGVGNDKVERRFRLCDSPPRSNGGQDCVGPSVQTRARFCTFNACAVDGVYGQWSEWNTVNCINTCGVGEDRVESRVRRCDSPAPTPGGRPCVGSSTDVRIRNCTFNPCVVDGQFGQWSFWTDVRCDNLCGDGEDKVETRSRRCDSPAPTFGGRDCVGSSLDTRVVNCSLDPCIIDGQFGQWSLWTIVLCDNTCGVAPDKRETRTRQCDSPAPSNGGRDCVGSSEEVRFRNCRLASCGVDGQFGQWSLWTIVLCDNTCGVGTDKRETRTRQCDSPAPSNGGRDCVGSSEDVRFRNCRLASCAVDGQFGQWSTWTVVLCDNTCGIGADKRETRTRQCDSPAPSNGGRDCVGSSEDVRFRNCRFTPCGVDGQFGQWSLWTIVLCDNTCGIGADKRETRTRQCDSPAPSNGGRDCVGSSEDVRFRNCRFTPCAVDGQFGQWSLWTIVLCDNTCGVGPDKRETRTRQCDSPAPSNGGRDCIGSREDARTRSCSFDACVVPVVHLCSQVQLHNGVRYRYHPTECDQYIQCYFSSSGDVRAVYRSCPFSRLWNQATFRCEDPWRVTCPMDKCAENCPSHFDRLGSCRSYWQCDEKQILTPKCCLPGFSYDPTYGCQLNPFCRDPCPTACVDSDVCERRFDWTTPLKYQLYGGSFGWLDGTCADGTRYEHIDCGCTAVNSSCTPDYNTDFTNPQLSTALGTWLTASGVNFDNGRATFGPSSSLTSNVIMPLPGRRCSTAIRFRYREAATATGRRILLSTSDCRRGNSFIIAVEDDKMMFELTSWYSWTSKLPVYTQGMVRTEWRTVTVLYSGYDIIVSLESLNLNYIAKVTATESSIMRCGFMFGQDGKSDTTDMNFVGDLDSLTLYSCNPGTLF